jgi:hypothetical protein
VGFATLVGAFYMKTFGINKNDRVIGQLDLALFDLHSFAEISPKKCHNVSSPLTITVLKLFMSLKKETRFVSVTGML